MATTLIDAYFQTTGVKLEIAVPDLADVSAADYHAKKLSKKGEESDTEGEQRPFYPCHPVALTMKVETWLGKIITWTFDPNKDPIPLKRIYKTPVPVNATSNAEVTSIQVGY